VLTELARVLGPGDFVKWLNRLHSNKIQRLLARFTAEDSPIGPTSTEAEVDDIPALSYRAPRRRNRAGDAKLQAQGVNAVHVKSSWRHVTVRNALPHREQIRAGKIWGVRDSRPR